MSQMFQIDNSVILSQKKSRESFFGKLQVSGLLCIVQAQYSGGYV